MAKVALELPSPPKSQMTGLEGNGKVSLIDTNRHSQEKFPNVTYSVVHAIRGRLRFRLPRLRYDADYAKRLEVLLAADALVKNVRVKRAAMSVAVTYKSDKVQDAKMRSHLHDLIQAASEVVVLKNSTSLSETEKETSWPGLQLSAVATTLAVLGGPLGLPIPPLIVVLGGPLGLPIPPLIVVLPIAIATLPVVQRAWEGIRVERKLNIDFLDFMAIAITTFQGHFLTPSLMLSLIEVGENIRDRTARSSAQQTLDLLSSLGQFVWVERNGEKVQIPIQDVQRGDTVIVYPGEQVPVDGSILRGKALLDEQKLTGESMPVLKKKGQPVFASTLVREGRIYIVAEWIGNDTRAGQSIKLMQEAPVHDTRMENYATARSACPRYADGELCYEICSESCYANFATWWGSICRNPQPFKGSQCFNSRLCYRDSSISPNNSFSSINLCCTTRDSHP